MPDVTDEQRAGDRANAEAWVEMNWPWIERDERTAALDAFAAAIQAGRAESRARIAELEAGLRDTVAVVGAARAAVKEYDARNRAFGFDPAEYQTISVAVNGIRAAIATLDRAIRR